MSVNEVWSGNAPTDSDNKSAVTGETVRDAVSSMGTDHSDGVTVRELLNALVEKDRVLTTLLERLTPSATPQPMSAGTPGGIAAFQVMPDLSNNITSFSGCEDAPSAKDWIENLRTTATLHSWPESFMLETAKSRLTGPARDWLRSRRSEVKTWSDFEERFRRTFVSQTRAAERWRKMHERVQQRNESSVAYLHAKVRLCKEANLDFWDTREQVITGLRSKQLSTMLLGKKHEDDDDILHDIQEFERIERERQEFFGSARDHRAASNEARAPNVSALQARKSVEEESTKDRRPPVTNEKGERKCYNCSQYGHIARDCPQPKRPMKCLLCNGTDHTQRHCKEALQRNEANTVTEPVCEIKSASVLLKEVTLNGKFTVVGLIDTGSSGCLLRASGAARCGIEIVPETTDLYGFGNSTVPAAKSIGRCRTDLCIDGVLAKDIPILVVPDEAQCVDLLVGRTFTELPYIAYTRIGGSLRFWHCRDVPFAHQEPYESHQRMQPVDQGAAVMSESESVPAENNAKNAASEEKAPPDDKQEDGNSAAEESSDDEDPELGLLDQPLELSGSRQRKKVERLDVSFRTAGREWPPPEQGKGKPLGDCPRIEHNIKRERLESLKALHRLLFGRPGAPSEIKKNLRKFSGFPFEKDTAEYVKREKMVAKLKKTAYKHLLGMLDLEKSGTVEKCTDRILNFLLKPFENKKPLPATKKRKRKSMTPASADKGQARKRRTATPKAEKGKASRKRPAKKTSTPAKRRKVAKKEESDEDDESDEKEVGNDAHVSQLKAWPSISKTSHLDDDEESDESEHQLD